jgi:hypothetical protein
MGETVDYSRRLRLGNGYEGMRVEEENMPITLNDLTVDFTHLKRDEILTEWKWLIGKTKLPILLAASGDAFVEDTDDGSVHVLDVGAGELTKVADSFDDFRSLLTDKQFVADNFALEMIVDLRKSGKALKKGQIYSLKKPLILGGEYELENIEPTDIEIHFSMLGQIYEQASKLEPGTRISEIEFE